MFRSILVGAILMVFVGLGSLAALLSFQQHNDPSCYDTQEPRRRLDQQVARSPHHTTVAIAEASEALSKAYDSCADRFLQHGDHLQFVYAVSQGAATHEFTARLFYALNDTRNAQRSSVEGLQHIYRALAQPTAAQPTFLRDALLREQQSLQQLRNGIHK